VGLKAQEKTGLLLMPTAKVTKNVSAAEGGGNVLCSILISIKTKAWLYSLLGSNKLKAEREELQQRISALERQNEMLVQHIETMEQEHKEERTKFNEYIDKIQRYFPYVEKLLPLIDFCRNTLKFSERVVQELCKLKKVRLKGDFYSPEFNRKFHDESAAFSFEEDKNRKGHYHICVNDIPLVQWFRQKANEWRDGLGIASARQDKGLKI